MADTDDADFWDYLYESNQCNWDLGGPTPVFRRLAEEGRLAPGAMLVLGAGRGHDARLFARHGFSVTAVDFSTAAVAAMTWLDHPNFPVEIVEADFFALPPEWSGRFDYVLDYTCFCAILPNRRPEYADLVARMLKPGGRFIILAFPIGTRPGGPPFVVQPADVVDLFAERAFTLAHRERPPDSVPIRKGHEELLIMVKAQNGDDGRGDAPA